MLKELLQKNSKINIVNQNEKINGNMSVDKVVSETEIVLEALAEEKFELERQHCYLLCYMKNDAAYRCSARLVSDYYDEDVKKYVMKLVSPVEKFQRRKYKRFTYRDKMSYEVIRSENIGDTTNDTADLIDLSGGGVRFASSRELRKGDNLQFELKLRQDKNIDIINLKGRVVSSDILYNDKEKYDIRVSFTDISEEDRKHIIKYVFYLERNKC